MPGWEEPEWDLLQSSGFGGEVQTWVQGFQGLIDTYKLEKLTLQQIPREDQGARAQPLSGGPAVVPRGVV